MYDPGFGIGVSFGRVDLHTSGDRLELSGPPVVYACRYGDCPAAKTYVTQLATNKFLEKYRDFLTWSRVPITVKHETAYGAYEFDCRGAMGRNPIAPEWFSQLIPRMNQDPGVKSAQGWYGRDSSEET